MRSFSNILLCVYVSIACAQNLEILEIPIGEVGLDTIDGYGPSDFDIDEKERIYVVDVVNQSIKIFNNQGKLISSFSIKEFYSLPTDVKPFYPFTHIAVQDSCIYIAWKSKVGVYNLDGREISKFEFSDDRCIFEMAVDDLNRIYLRRDIWGAFYACTVEVYNVEGKKFKELSIPENEYLCLRLKNYRIFKEKEGKGYMAYIKKYLIYGPNHNEIYEVPASNFVECLGEDDAHYLYLLIREDSQDYIMQLSPTGSILNKIEIKEWGMAVWNYFRIGRVSPGGNVFVWAYKEGYKYVRMYKYLMKKDKSNDRSTG